MRWECPAIPAIPTSAVPTLQVLLVQPQVTCDVLFVTFGAVTFWPGAKKSRDSSDSQFFNALPPSNTPLAGGKETFNPCPCLPSAAFKCQYQIPRRV